MLHLLRTEKCAECAKNYLCHVWSCALHWVVPRKRRDSPLPMFGSDPPSSEQKEPRVLSVSRGGLMFPPDPARTLDSNLFTVGLIAAITCSINTGTGYGGGTLVESLGVCARILVGKCGYSAVQLLHSTPSIHTV